jgi:hypothetical protein
MLLSARSQKVVAIHFKSLAFFYLHYFFEGLKPVSGSNDQILQLLCIAGPVRMRHSEKVGEPDGFGVTLQTYQS